MTSFHPLPTEISSFIDSHHAMSVAVKDEAGLWCFTCFYVFDQEECSFVFVSDRKSRHGAALGIEACVSGTISNDEKNILKIKGIQFSGIAIRTKGNQKQKAMKLFIKTFPLAILSRFSFWLIIPTQIKYTDNSKFFSAKTLWHRQS